MEQLLLSILFIAILIYFFNSTLIGKILWKLIRFSLLIIYNIFYWIITGNWRKDKSEHENLYGSARWMTDEEIANRFCKKGEQGSASLNGADIRLTKKSGCKNLGLFASPGAGKSTILGFPGIYQNYSDSMIVLDVSGQYFEGTSGEMKSRGFNVRSWNFDDIACSETWNPLSNPNLTDFDLINIATTIVNAAFPNAQDVYWNSAAIGLIVTAMKLLRGLDSKFRHLSQIYMMLNRFDGGKGWVELASQEHVDENTFYELEAFMRMPSNTLEGVLSNARTALRIFQSSDVAKLTSSNTLGQLSEIRKKPTILYLIVPEHMVAPYGFLIVLFFKQLFDQLNVMPEETDLDVICLLDEFGNIGRIPDFERVIATLRKRRVSIQIYLQNRAQLRIYGSQAQTIYASLGTTVWLPGGTTLEDAEMISKMAGNRTVELKEEGYQQEGEEGKGSFRNTSMGRPLITPQEVLNLPSGKAIIFHLNDHIALVNTYPYYENSSYLKMSQKPPATVACNAAQCKVHYYNLKPPEITKENNDDFNIEL